jgi:hypothetical protein
VFRASTDFANPSGHSFGASRTGLERLECSHVQLPLGLSSSTTNSMSTAVSPLSSVNWNGNAMREGTLTDERAASMVTVHRHTGRSAHPPRGPAFGDKRVPPRVFGRPLSRSADRLGRSPRGAAGVDVGRPVPTCAIAQKRSPAGGRTQGGPAGHRRATPAVCVCTPRLVSPNDRSSFRRRACLGPTP